MDGACITHGTDKKCIQNVVGKPEGKRLLGSHRRSGLFILKWI
jgi:hypothetical protein